MSALNPHGLQVSIKRRLSKEVLWEGDQRKLFRKYAAERSRSIQQIVLNLEAVKQVDIGPGA
jgi:hypothetical protein